MSLVIRIAAADEDAARMLAPSRARLDTLLATLGGSARPPWHKDQKDAAAAALVALKQARI